MTACMSLCVFVLILYCDFSTVTFRMTNYKTVYQITFDFLSPLLQLSYQIHTHTSMVVFLSRWEISLETYCFCTELLIFSIVKSQILPSQKLDFQISLRHYLVCYLTCHCLVKTFGSHKATTQTKCDPHIYYWL